MKAFRFFLMFLFIAAFPLAAEHNRLGVPDSSEIRAAAAERWFYADLEVLRENRTELRRNPVGQNFQIRLEENDLYYSVIVAPETFLTVDFYTENGMKRDTVSEYPADAAGSWIFMRDSRTGKPVHIRYYFAADSDVYVQFYPNKGDVKKSLADFVINGCFAARGVPCGVPFESFYTASFSDVLTFTGKSLPWKYSDVHPEQFHGTLQMIGVIRKNLKRIRSEWDACYNEDGKPVKISDGKKRVVPADEEAEKKLSLSSAGFVKWIVDGIIEPMAGSLTFLDPLLRPTVKYNPVGSKGIKNEKENVNFTLDWTRNLAAARLSIQTRKKYLYEESGVDVNIEPFSAEVSASGINSVAGYLKNTGYDIKRLRPVMYVLGVTEPTYFYLAAVKRRIPASGNKPEYYVFDQTAVIFPFFDKNRQFGCVVFEDGEELTLAQFVNRYPDSYVHLTRVLSTDRFFPL